MSTEALPAMIEFERHAELTVLRMNDAAVAAILAGTLDIGALLRDVAQAGML